MDLADFTINNNISKELYDKINIDTIRVVNKLVREDGGEIYLNEELNVCVYRQVSKSKSLELKKRKI